MSPRTIRPLSVLAVLSTVSSPGFYLLAAFAEALARRVHVEFGAPVRSALALLCNPLLHSAVHHASFVALLFGVSDAARRRGFLLRTSPWFAALSFFIPLVNFVAPYRQLRAVEEGLVELGRPPRVRVLVLVAQGLAAMELVVLVVGFFRWPPLLWAVLPIIVGWALCFAVACARLARELEALPEVELPTYIEGESLVDPAAAVL